MKRIFVGIVLLSATVFAQDGPYKILQTAKVGGDGRFDYVYADSAGRKLYVARRGPDRVSVYDLDKVELVREIANTSAAGAAVSTKSGHGFASSKPVAMWDSKTLAPIKTIDVEGGPDGILYDPFNDRVYIFSHRAPNATVIDAADGKVLGTIDLGGAPEQGVSDGKGHVYVDVEDKGNVAVIDAKTMTVTAHYDLEGKGNQCAGLALDVKNEILFATCRAPQNMVILSAKDGKIITTLPIGQGTDGAVFNPSTMEAFSSQGDGTLTIVKEKSGKDFEVEQNLTTMRGAKTLTLDSTTGHILLIAAQTAPPPADAPPPAPGGRGGRGSMVPGSFTILVVGK
jgi:DNA-binding beta-propeller fold protein YncE